MICKGNLTHEGSLAKVDMKFDIVVIPVSDVERANDCRGFGVA